MSRPLFVDSRRDLLGVLIDYAGMFPPASLDAEAAVAEYRRSRSDPAGWLLGAFVAAAGRLEDVAAVLVPSMTAGEAPWRISVVLDGDPATAAAAASAFEAHMSPAATITGAEVRLFAGDGSMLDDAAALRAATAATSISAAVVPFLEIPGTGEPAAVADAVAAVARLRRAVRRRSLGAKLRCGGATPGHSPSPEAVASFLAACRAHGLAFKLTAGLHHPIRHHDPELGAMRHGFVNLLVACALAEQGADAATVTAAVAESDPAAFKVGSAGLGWRDRRVPAPVVKQMRRERFLSYGSCSFDEPVRDLEALGVLAPAEL